jgi:hypothetical protein
VGSGALRSKMPMLSRPREAPAKTLRPVGILAIDPPVEVEHQALERALEEPQVGPAQLLLVLVQPERGPAWTGGFTSLKFHS